ncbi:MAG: hypothetical protein ABJA79_02855 [Parafilimonas sp.]
MIFDIHFAKLRDEEVEEVKGVLEVKFYFLFDTCCGNLLLALYVMLHQNNGFWYE